MTPTFEVRINSRWCKVDPVTFMSWTGPRRIDFQPFDGPAIPLGALRVRRGPDAYYRVGYTLGTERYMVFFQSREVIDVDANGESDAREIATHAAYWDYPPSIGQIVGVDGPFARPY